MAASPLTMTGVPSGSAPTATAHTSPRWPRSGSPSAVPSASRHTRTVMIVAAADDDRGAVRQRPGRHRVHPAAVAGQRLPDRSAVGGPPHPHRAVGAAADDDRGAVRQRPGRHRSYLAGVAGDDLVASGPATVGPAGLPGPVRGGARDAGGQAAAAEAVGGQFELAGPHWPVEARKEVGGLPVHGGGRPRRGGSRRVEVGHQPRRIDGEQVERILQKLIEPAGGGGVLGCVFAQVTVLPAGALGLAEEHVEQGAFIAGLMQRGEQLVGEGLVEQPGDRARAALGGRGLQQVVGGLRTAQRIKIGDAGVVAEGGGESEPGAVVQPRAAGVRERREQLAVPFPPLVG